MAFLPAIAAFATANAGTIAAVSAVTTLAGAGVSAYGQIQQGKAARREANYNAAVDENNAISAGYAAIQETQAASREVEQLRETRLRNLGSQRAAAAHSGLTISGSVLDTMGDSALEIEKEIQMTKYRGRIGAYNLQQQGNNLRSRATMTRIAGKNAQSSSRYAAGGTLLSGASTAASGYSSFKP